MFWRAYDSIRFEGNCVAAFQNAEAYLHTSRGLHSGSRRKDVHNRRACHRVWCFSKCGLWVDLLDLYDAMKMPPVFVTGGIFYEMYENQSGVGG